MTQLSSWQINVYIILLYYIDFLDFIKNKLRMVNIVDILRLCKVKL